MHRVLSRASKLSKIIGKANFITKINKPLNLLAMQASSKLISTSKMNFAENERRFEKFSDSSAGSPRQGKHNIRANLATERLQSILEYIENNAQAFNDGDYFDSLYIVSQKLEIENNRINMRRPGIKLLNDFVVNNFQKHSNTMSNTLLMYLSALASKDIKLLNREQSQNFAQKNMAFLEKNHANMPLFPLLNIISMLGFLININPIPLLKGRDGELSGISMAQLMRVGRRLASPNQTFIVRSFITKLISPELLNKVEGDKLLQKARVLNLLCRIDSMDHLINLTPKIRSLIKMIMNELDQLDNLTILPIVDAMVYWEDYNKNDFLREINEVVSSTITHSPDSIYPDFFVRYLESFSKIRSDFGLTADHLRLFLEFYLKNKKPEEIRNPKSLICFFTVMRKCKLFEKQYIEQLFDITLNQIPYMPIDENLRSYRNLISNHLTEAHLQKVREVVNADISKMLNDTEKSSKLVIVLNALAKLCFFDCDKELMENSYNKAREILASLDPKGFQRILENYVRNVQDFIKPQYRDGIVSEIINKIDPTTEAQAHAKIYVFLNECLVSRENDELRKKMQTLSTQLSEQPQFKNGLIRTFETLTDQNEGNTPITNLSFSKYIFLLREMVKDEAFIGNKEKNIILNIMQTTYNLVKQNKMDSKISEDLLNSFLRVGNDIVTKYPNTLISLNVQKLANFLKVFSMEDLESPLLEKLAISSLEKQPAERYERDLGGDMIAILEKMTKGEKTTQKTELIKRILGSEERMKGLLENSGIYNQVYKLLTQFNKIDTQLVSDDVITFGKNLLIKKLRDENVPIFNKLNIIYSLSNSKSTLLNETELKELSQDIQNIFSEFSAKRLTRTLSNAPLNINRGTLSRIIHIKYAGLYEKDETPNKQLALRTLERFTAVRWPFISLYNKFISDYGSLFEKFNSLDHVNVINYFSRMDIAREDIVNTACNAINMQQLSENDKLTLFKSLVKLGFYKNESGKNPVVERLLTGIDYSYVLRKQGIGQKIQLLFNGWKLSQSGYEVKGLIDTLLENLSKINVERVFEAKRRYTSDNVNYFLLKSNLVQNLDENTKKYLTALFQQRKALIPTKFAAKILKSYLTVMNQTFEEFPESNLVDIYIPEGKIGILLADSNCLNIFDRRPIDDFAFVFEELKKNGINPVIISLGEISRNFRESNKNHEAFIEIIEKSFNIPNKNVEKKYDFTALETTLNMRAATEHADEE